MIEDSTLRILRSVQPSKTLLQGKKYTPAANTDIRKTLEKFQRLARMRQRKSA
jgi:hypothetical protein